MPRIHREGEETTFPLSLLPPSAHTRGLPGPAAAFCLGRAAAPALSRLPR